MRTLPVAAALGATALLGACGGPSAGSSGAGGDLRGPVSVFAASSLTDPLEVLRTRFEDEHPGVEVSLNLAGSSALAAQVVSGAPADVFVAASPETMRTVTQAGRAAGSPEVLVRNQLQLVVPAGNPAGVRGLEALTDDDLRIALCAPQVPCGVAAGRLLEAAGVTPVPDTLEQDVRAVLTKVRLGEVDAALVYRTDVLSADDEVDGVDVPGAEAVVTDYEVAVLDDAPNEAAARSFVEYLLGEEGRRVLVDAGFTAP